MKLPVKPMLCSPQKEMYLDKYNDDWIAEVKYDGERIMAERKGGRITMWTRRQHEVAYRFPEVVSSLMKCMPALDWIIDCELTVDGGFENVLKRNRNDMPSINLLSKKMPATLNVFDVLKVGDLNLSGYCLSDRRTYLKNMLKRDGAVRPSMYFRGPRAKQLFEKVTEVGGEGVVMKQLDSHYVPGSRSPFWQKIKKTETVDVEIVAATVSERFPFGALVMVKDGRYYGKVGTGFTEKLRSEVLRKLKQHPDTKDFSRWGVSNEVYDSIIQICSPLRAEVKILETHSSGSPRHPVWVRWRE